MFTMPHETGVVRRALCLTGHTEKSTHSKFVNQKKNFGSIRIMFLVFFWKNCKFYTETMEYHLRNTNLGGKVSNKYHTMSLQPKKRWGTCPISQGMFQTIDDHACTNMFARKRVISLLLILPKIDYQILWLKFEK